MISLHWLYALAGAVFAALVELFLIRPLYKRHIEQVLVTVGLGLATTALLVAIWGNDARPVPAPAWLGKTTTLLGAHIPNDRWVLIVTAVVVLLALNAFLRRTRYGLIIRAGVENRAMVTALGIDVRRAFTLVFAIGGVAAAPFGALLARHMPPRVLMTAVGLVISCLSGWQIARSVGLL